MEANIQKVLTLPKFQALWTNTLKPWATVTVEQQVTAESGFAATYVVKQNNVQVGAKINIPKDFLVKSATLNTSTAETTATTGIPVGHKYIDFVVNTIGGDGTASHIYLDVADLVDVYTPGSTAQDMVVIAIDAQNRITATVTDGSITKAKLATAVQTSLELADSALQPVVPAAVGNVPTLAADGTLVDSGKTIAQIQSEAVADKMDKVATGTENNFVALDANGNAKDSGYNYSTFVKYADIVEVTDAEIAAFTV